MAALSAGSIAVIVISLTLIVYILLISVVTFCRFFIDKRRAQSGKWRVSEKELYILGLLGGAIGGFVSMWAFRHKTAKTKFCVPYTVLFIVNLLVLIAIIGALVAVPIVLR